MKKRYLHQIFIKLYLYITKSNSTLFIGLKITLLLSPFLFSSCNNPYLPNTPVGEKANSAPIAQIEIIDSNSGIAPLTRTFDASKSYDLDGKIYSYHYKVRDVNTQNLIFNKIQEQPKNWPKNQTEENLNLFSYTFLKGGLYEVSVEVTDDLGKKNNSNKINVRVVDTQRDHIIMDQPAYKGSGCPPKSVQSILSPDRHSISILFSNYSYNLLNSNNSSTFSSSYEFKDCHLEIPIKVPKNKSVALFRFDYRGYIDLPINIDASLEVEYQFLYPDDSSSSIEGPATYFEKKFLGNEIINNNYIITHEFSEHYTNWSKCGNDFTLKIDSILSVMNNNVDENLKDFERSGLFTLDSLDGTSGITYFIAIRDC